MKKHFESLINGFHHNKEIRFSCFYADRLNFIPSIQIIQSSNTSHCVSLLRGKCAAAAATLYLAPEIPRVQQPAAVGQRSGPLLEPEWSASGDDSELVVKV